MGTGSGIDLLPANEDAGPREPINASPGTWLTRGRALTLLGGYFLIQAVVRALVSDTAELDESEQLLFTQAWQWGYGPHVPLYTWLQILVFQVLGTNILGLAVLKNGLLFGTCVLTCWAAKELVGNDRLAVLGMLSLLLFPQFTWESQRDLTHSVLASALAVATFLAALRVSKTGAVWHYMILGVCLGFGVLSKFSYGLIALALGVAALTVPALRQRMLSPRFLLTLGLFLLIITPYARWFFLSPEVALSRAREVVRSNQGDPFLTRLQGLFSLVKCAIMLFGVLGLTFWFAFRKTSKASAFSSPLGQWLGRTLLVLVLFSVIIVLTTGISLKDRWFQPTVFLLALSAVVLVHDRVNQVAARRFVGVIATIAAAALVILPGIPLAAAFTGRPTRLNAPYAELCAKLKSAGAGADVIVAPTRWVGGNLRLGFPLSTVIAPEFPSLPAAANIPWLLVWDATKNPAPPDSLLKLVVKRRGQSPAAVPPSYVEAPYLFMRARQMKVGYIRLAGEPGA